MLSRQLAVSLLAGSRFARAGRQDGVVLLIALIILVALSLGGIALLRSVDTTNLISGNLAFQQAATFSGEVGTQDAVRAIRTASTVALEQNHFGAHAAGGWAYSATSTGADDPATAADWDAYWTATIEPNPLATPVTAFDCADRVCTLPTDDDVRNTVSYTIQRLCADTGPVASAKCIGSPEMFPNTGNSKDGKNPPLPMKTQVYYRITTRIAGPRNTVSYIQTIVSR